MNAQLIMGGKGPLVGLEFLLLLEWAANRAGSAAALCHAGQLGVPGVAVVTDLIQAPRLARELQSVADPKLEFALA